MTSTNQNRARLAAGLLITFALVMSGCPVQWQGQKPGGNTDTAFIAGVFYDFMAIGKDRVNVPEEKRNQPQLYVARFSNNGEARWMRSFGPLAPAREVSFLAERDRIMVVGVITEALRVEETRFHVPTTPGRDQAIFFASFDLEGRTMAATRLAAATHLSSVQIRRNGKSLEVGAALRGGVDVPGQPQLPDGGHELKLKITPEGAVVHADVIVRRETMQPAPAISPMHRKGARLDDPTGSQQGYMLASMLMQTCDYCAWNDKPRWDGACSTCRDKVCTTTQGEESELSWCCDVWWNVDCMRDASAKCTANTETCKCSHSTCSTTNTAPMQSFCLGRQPCVSTVVGRDSTCATSSWHSGCQRDAANPALCSPACP